ncbi:MAG: demethoxyubiquinone hydroxylase family protein [Rickettsia endosymbiont of Bryobia graminum]|nr:demethoxyubiquinone hydroxylase family protein [Rickettsia endosymbiont of Bryobia graminum]
MIVNSDESDTRHDGRACTNRQARSNNKDNLYQLIMAKPNFSSNNIIQEIIRVDHAGEYGARRIYEGQLNYTRNHQDRITIHHMLEQEKEHLAYFNNLLLARNVRPTILMPFWYIIGYILGSGSVLLGTKTAMLLTQGIEETIEQHYQKQIDYLSSHNIEEDLLAHIKQFQQEEIEHRDIALEQGSSKVAFAPLIKNSIKLMCKLAISLSKKL